jgi:sugar phosphate isomerase/epimerase
VAVALPLLADRGLAAEPAAAGKAGGWAGLKLGVASYTLRKMPVDDAIKAIGRVGLSYVSIKDFHLPLKTTAEERRAVAAKFKAAGITPLSCGVITTQNNQASVRAAFEYARDAGIPTIVGSPDPASLPILDKMVKEFDIKLAIHNHGPGDTRWPLPADVFAKVEAFDPRIGLCIDCGHTLRLGADPAEAIVKFRSRVHDVHLKDISKAEPAGDCIEAGRGVMNLKAVLQALVQIKFAGLIGIEYEKDADDVMPGLAETVGYLHGLLAGMA